jgi:hypothetical protein
VRSTVIGIASGPRFDVVEEVGTIPLQLFQSTFGPDIDP